MFRAFGFLYSFDLSGYSKFCVTGGYRNQVRVSHLSGSCAFGFRVSGLGLRVQGEGVRVLGIGGLAFQMGSPDLPIPLNSGRCLKL